MAEQEKQSTTVRLASEALSEVNKVRTHAEAITNSFTSGTSDASVLMHSAVIEAYTAMIKALLNEIIIVNDK